MSDGGAASGYGRRRHAIVDFGHEEAGDSLGAGRESADAAGHTPDPKDREVGPVGLACGWRLVLLANAVARSISAAGRVGKVST